MMSQPRKLALSLFAGLVALLAWPAAALAEGWTVLDPILGEGGLQALEHNINHALGPTYVSGSEHWHVTHIIFGLLVFVLGIAAAFRANHLMMSRTDGYMPPTRWGTVAFFDLAIQAILGTMESMMPREKALKFLPLMVAFAVFILMSNLLGLVPGFLPPTESLNTTAALGLSAFLFYNWHGIRTHGVVNYLKHFMGPIPALAPLLFPIEIVSHLVRPASLALRLMGNMFGDHKVLTIFLGFNLLFVPLPMIAMGMLVCVVQTVVFTMLAIVYVALAVEEHDHDEHDHGGAHAAAH